MLFQCQQNWHLMWKLKLFVKIFVFARLLYISTAVIGGKWQWAIRAVPWVPWLKNISWYLKAVHPFRFKHFKHLILVYGGITIKDMVVGATYPGFLYYYNNGKAWMKSFAWCNFVDVSSVVWLFNLIIINHPHRPILAKSECSKSIAAYIYIWM